MEKSKFSFNDIIEYAKKLWKDEKREFCIIASKASFSFLFFLTLFFKFYYGGVWKYY